MKEINKKADSKITLRHHVVGMLLGGGLGLIIGAFTGTYETTSSAVFLGAIVGEIFVVAYKQVL